MCVQHGCKWPVCLHGTTWVPGSLSAFLQAGCSQGTQIKQEDTDTDVAMFPVITTQCSAGCCCAVMLWLSDNGLVETWQENNTADNENIPS